MAGCNTREENAAEMAQEEEERAAEVAGFMSGGQTGQIKVGDKLQILVGGSGTDDNDEERTFGAGEIVTVISAERLPRIGLSIGIETQNGIVNFFDALDFYGGKYPFKRTK